MYLYFLETFGSIWNLDFFYDLSLMYFKETKHKDFGKILIFVVKLVL